MALQGKKERSGGGNDGVLENPKRRKVGAIAGKQKPSKQSQCHCCCLFHRRRHVVFLRLLKGFPSDFLVSSLLMLSKLHVNPSPLHVYLYPIFPPCFVLGFGDSWLAESVRKSVFMRCSCIVSKPLSLLLLVSSSSLGHCFSSS